MHPAAGAGFPFDSQLTGAEGFVFQLKLALLHVASSSRRSYFLLIVKTKVLVIVKFFRPLEAEAWSRQTQCCFWDILLARNKLQGNFRIKGWGQTQLFDESAKIYYC